MHGVIQAAMSSTNTVMIEELSTTECVGTKIQNKVSV